MKEFTEDESYRIARKMRENSRYTWVKDGYIISPTEICVVMGVDVDDLNKKWDLESLSVEAEIIPLD